MFTGVTTYSNSTAFLKGGDSRDKNFFEKEEIDYYPFGMLMPNRHGQGDEYRYGFNGAEKDDEIRGTKGASYDLGARMYDPRVARMLSVDPWYNKYPWQSPYVYHSNSPIAYIDWKGLGDPKDRKLNSNINGGKGNKSEAGNSTSNGFYADVSMTNGNTNNPAMAFPSKMAKANGITLQQLYDMNPGLKENRHNIGQGQFIRTVKEPSKQANDCILLKRKEGPRTTGTTEKPNNPVYQFLEDWDKRLEEVSNDAIETDIPATSDGQSPEPILPKGFEWLDAFNKFSGNSNPSVSNTGGGSGGSSSNTKPVLKMPKGYTKTELTPYTDCGVTLKGFIITSPDGSKVQFRTYTYSSPDSSGVKPSCDTTFTDKNGKTVKVTGAGADAYNFDCY